MLASSFSPPPPLQKIENMFWRTLGFTELLVSRECSVGKARAERDGLLPHRMNSYLQIKRKLLKSFIPSVLDKEHSTNLATSKTRTIACPGLDPGRENFLPHH